MSRYENLYIYNYCNGHYYKRPCIVKRVSQYITAYTPRSFIKSENTQEKDYKTLPNSIKIPSPEDKVIETLVFKTYLVEIRVGKKFFLCVLPVEGAEPTYWHSSKEDIVALVHNIVVDRCP
jgi:hypothetical protein